jgi:hypothetical protein
MPSIIADVTQVEANAASTPSHHATSASGQHPASPVQHAIIVDPSQAGVGPKPEDITWLNGTPIPPDTGKHPSRTSFTGFTPAVNAVLQKPEVIAYFGARANLGALPDAAQRYTQAEGVRQRFLNGADMAARIGAPDGVIVETALAEIMKHWPAFSAAFPAEAITLAPLRAWWVARHKTGKKKSQKAAQNAAANGATPPAAGTNPGSAPTTPAK